MAKTVYVAPPLPLLLLPSCRLSVAGMRTRIGMLPLPPPACRVHCSRYRMGWWSNSGDSEEKGRNEPPPLLAAVDGAAAESAPPPPVVALLAIASNAHALVEKGRVLRMCAVGRGVGVKQ